MCPIRLGDYRPPHSDKVEFASLEPPREFFETSKVTPRLPALAQARLHIAVESARTDCHGRLTGDLFGPTGPVQVASLEGRFPEAPLRAIEKIDTGFAHGHEQIFKFGRLDAILPL